MRPLGKQIMQGLVVISLVGAVGAGVAWHGARLKRLEHQALSSLSLFSLAQEIDKTITEAVGGTATAKLALYDEKGVHKVTLLNGVYRSEVWDDKQSSAPLAVKKEGVDD
jgi:hypothetical protein